MPSEEEKMRPSRTPVGQYYLLDKIAQGGMAEIYKGLAYDLHGLKKTVVIKKILPQIAADPEFIQMLVNEAKIAVMLSHGNIAQIYDLGKVGTDYFMVMEYVDGKSLSQIHKKNVKLGTLIPIDHVVYFISEVASALNYMHRRIDEQGRNLGIVHRDISPQNVIISYSGTVKIIDFGIAKAAIQIAITDSGILKGKFAYMSPEQASGETIDNRSDIFALGVILHELLTGRRLFKGHDKRETLKNVRRAVVPLPSGLRADLPQDLDAIVLKALAKDPKKRYLWASDFRNDLIKFLYTHYPDFQPSSIGHYIQTLFRDEVAEKEELEEEAKTPFLIIDQTQSAILPEKLEKTSITRVPPQISEFMLDEETPLPQGIPPPLPSEKIDFDEHCRRFFKRHSAVITAALGAIVIAALAVAGFRSGLITISPHPHPPPLQGGRDEGRGGSETDSRWASLRLTSEPPGADIFLNNEKTNLKTPATLESLKADTDYSIGFYLEGYIFWSQNFKLKPNEKKTIHAALSPNFGGLEIISSPPGAIVVIDGEAIGVTPFKMERVVPGRVMKIRVSKEGFTSWSENTKINVGPPIVLRPKLERTKESLVPDFLKNLDKSKPPKETMPPPPSLPPKTDASMLPPAPAE